MKRSFEEFEIIETLGVGTVGTVYRAYDRVLGQEVALKILLPAVSADRNIRARFRREIAILERLDHPHIVRCFGDGEHQGRLFFAMELVRGGTLKDVLIRRGRLSWQEAVELGWQVCSALQYLHNVGIVHRDLKPSNIYISDEGLVKLGDFGIALDTGKADITAVGMTVGSYLYMAPEQIRGERSVSGKTDLYALGCLLFEMLTGRPPFGGTNFAQIFEQHLHATPPRVDTFAPDVPPRLVRLVDRLLQKDPDQRPLNAREVQGELAEVLIEWDEEHDTRLREKLAQRQPKGSTILSGLIEELHQGPPTDKVSWATLAGVTAAVAAFVFLAWAVQR
ncbi:MAG: serine/threonine protein kinase [Planctomycetota bacterium]|nr:MAG: serine/threonine protein kinase [Planctomycetota bacterium]